MKFIKSKLYDCDQRSQVLKVALLLIMLVLGYFEKNVLAIKIAHNRTENAYMSIKSGKKLVFFAQSDGVWHNLHWEGSTL